jgi:hypothetical protein
MGVRCGLRQDKLEALRKRLSYSSPAALSGSLRRLITGAVRVYRLAKVVRRLGAMSNAYG